MSIASEIIDRIIKQFNNRKMFESDENFEAYLDKKRKLNAKTYYLKYHFPKEIIVESQKIDNMRYIVLNRVNCKKTVFYFHGGSYIDKPLMFHFRFVEKLLLKLKICVVFPIYPRLPDNTAETCYKKLNHLFDDFVSKNVVEEVVFMGDSAGGGIALSMAQQTKQTHTYCASGGQKVVLLSPWLDVSTDNPDIANLEKSDFQLSQWGLSKLGKIWADGNTKNPLASPLFGDLDCGKISLFTGTREILYPDNIVLKNKMEEQGLSINFHEYKNMPHCFMLMPTPEAERTFKSIVKCM